MIERATGRPATAGDGGRFTAPGAEESLRRALAAAERADVMPEARSGIAAKAALTGVPAAELAQRVGAIDVQGAEVRRMMEQRDEDRARAERDRARTATAVADLGVTR